MQDLKEHIERVKGYQATKATWRRRFDSPEFKDASRLNSKLFGIPLNKAVKCQCIEDLFYYITNLTSEKLTLKTQQMTGQFKFKPGTVIGLHGMAVSLTNDNLTDEKAIELLKKYNGSHIGSFEKYPANWKELCGLEGEHKKAAAGHGKEKGKEKKEASPAGTQAPGTSEEAKKAEALKTQVDFLLTKKKGDLVKMCQDSKYPEAEWGELTQKELAPYIAEKVNANPVA